MVSCQIVRPLPHPALDDLRLPDVLFALSDPHRLHIVRTLAEQGELACAAVGLPLSKSACSRHYKTLRECGLIRMRPHGTACLNSLRKRDLEQRFPGLLKAVLRSATKDANAKS